MFTKNFFVITITLISLIYTIPNFYGESPAIIISKKDIFKNNEIEEIKNLINIDEKLIKKKNENTIFVKFKSTEEQLNYYEIIKNYKKEIYTSSLNIISNNESKIFEKISAKSMKLGLDLRGGVQLTVKISYENIISNNLKGYLEKIKEFTQPE